MTHFSLDQFGTFLTALVAAISAFVAAWNSHKAAKIALAVQSTQLALASSRRADPAAAETPGLSIADALRYWDLLSRIKATWAAVRGQPVGVVGTLPLISGVKIDGRRADMGPTPIVFRD